MKKCVFLLLLFSTYCCSESEVELAATAELKVRVIVRAENGTPLPGKECGVGFRLPGKTWDTYELQRRRGLTDDEGVFVAEGRSMNGFGVGSQPMGYYMSHRSIYLNEEKGGKWMPFPRVETLLLKRIVNPVPMYAIAAWPIVIPAKSGAFGFDLEKRDWVAPHGAGVSSDLVFTQEKKEDAVRGSTATLRVSFSNPGDGIIPLHELKGAESELRLPRTAPVEGYEGERTLAADWNVTSGLKHSGKPALGYLFRVRTQLDEAGSVKSAWYGKIDGEFDWDPRNFNTAQVMFTYYLNPDGTTNLEFDRKANLFRELSHENEVKWP